MDTLLTVTTVAAAALWTVLRLFRRRRPGACESGCTGCPFAGRGAGGDACAAARPRPGPMAVGRPSPELETFPAAPGPAA